MSGPLQEGSVFAGRYRVLRRIATGAMGVVYEVVHLGTERHRALKVMHPHLFQNDEMRERFAQEARVTSRIESEYIVDVSDAGVDEATRTPFLVMELLQGEELGRRLKRVGRFSPSEVVTYLSQTALALDRTHKASIVHRDLKPANLFLTEREDGTPRIKILDFGVAKLMTEGTTSGSETQSLGTPLYMSPEQFIARTKLTGSADIYALGMVAYTLLVGEPYWRAEAQQADDVIAFALIASEGPRDLPSQRAAARGVTLPDSFDAWFTRVTAKLPEERFGTATEAIRALAEALGVAKGMETASSSDNLMAPARSGSLDPSAGARLTPASNLGQMSTSTGAMMTGAPRAMSKGVLVAALMVAGGALGGGAFALVQWGSNKPSVSPAEPPDAASAIVAAAISGAGAKEERSTAGSAAPAPSAETKAALPTTSAAATTSATTSATARPPSRPGAQTPSGSKKPAPAGTSLERLLGRD